MRQDRDVMVGTATGSSGSIRWWYCLIWQELLEWFSVMRSVWRLGWDEAVIWREKHEGTAGIGIMTR